jgi:CRP-like cAMP-binding protein
MMDEVDFLAQVSVFSMMKRSDLERLSKLARRHSFREADVIVREGERDGRLFVIMSGEVEVVIGLGGRNERAVRTLGPQTYFGEMALIDDLVRSASVVAKTDTELLSLDQWDFKEEIERYPALAFEMLQMLSRRIRAIEKTLKNTIGTFLPICANCKKIRQSDDSWTPIDKYISDHSETEFSHLICPECSKELYPEL